MQAANSRTGSTPWAETWQFSQLAFHFTTVPQLGLILYNREERKREPLLICHKFWPFSPSCTCRMLREKEICKYRF